MYIDAYNGGSESLYNKLAYGQLEVSQRIHSISVTPKSVLLPRLQGFPTLAVHRNPRNFKILNAQVTPQMS